MSMKNNKMTKSGFCCLRPAFGRLQILQITVQIIRLQAGVYFKILLLIVDFVVVLFLLWFLCVRCCMLYVMVMV
jgi:hypothetical protein